MNVLIVIAHPEPKSLNHAMAAAMRDQFKERGWNVAVSDLYAQRFRAAPSSADFRMLHDPERFSLAHEQRLAQHSDGYRCDIQYQHKALRAADLVVFQFPLWWYAPPAILKGWVERVFGKGFAYDDTHMFETGLLRGKRALLSITTGGSRAELDADAVHTGSVEQFLKPFTGGVLAFSGIEVEEPFIAYAVGGMGQPEREQVLAALRARVDLLAAAVERQSTGDTPRRAA